MPRLSSIRHEPRSRHGTPSVRRRRTRGQSLVEFALVLPILLFLTLTALDFGRIYLGYINIQNMARIAANYAANNPNAWTGGGDADAQAQFRNQILQDGAVTNCALPKSGSTTDRPDADVHGRQRRRRREHARRHGTGRRSAARSASSPR